MPSNDPASLAAVLQEANVVLEGGLTDGEVSKIEKTFGFRFPDDLRGFLQYALPVSEGFPNWRKDDITTLKSRLEWPAHGVYFDITNNGFWVAEWGPRPEDKSVALRMAQRELAKAPTLIPVYSHRYIPEEPHLAGNPIFSVHQTDIIYYGKNLTDYFHHEFLAQKPTWREYSEIRRIRFWWQLVEEL